MTVFRRRRVSGIAISFATQKLVSNCIGGILIFVTQPFVEETMYDSGIEGQSNSSASFDEYRRRERFLFSSPTPTFSAQRSEISLDASTSQSRRFRSQTRSRRKSRCKSLWMTSPNSRGHRGCVSCINRVHMTLKVSQKIRIKAHRRRKG